MENKTIIKQLPGWDKLNNLGKSYYDLMQQGYGTTFKNRCEEQEKIINEIIEGVYPYLIKIANELLKDEHKIRTKNGYKSLSLKWRKKSDIYSIGDLANEAAEYIFKCFNKYDTRKGSISNFVDMKATNIMFRYGIKNDNLVKLPFKQIERFGKINLEEDFEARLNELNPKRELSLDILYYNYLAYKRGVTKLNDSIENIPPSKDVAELEDTINNILNSKLYEKERNIIRLSFGFDEQELTLREIGANLKLSRTSIGKIKNNALKKLRKSSEIEKLREFL